MNYTLKNGATLLALITIRQGEFLVMARRGDGEWVTWVAWEDEQDRTVLHCGTGHYFQTRDAAFIDLGKRMGFRPTRWQEQIDDTDKW